MVLFLNACARNDSRTKKLAKVLLKVLDEYVKEVELYKLDIPLLSDETIKSREEAAKKQDDADPFVALSKEFADANTIVIAAPYWDLAYPAKLRAYIEAVMTRGITFDILDNGDYKGLCKAKELYYITTSGGIIGDVNLGYEHIKDLASRMWGVEKCYYYSAEGLDLAGNDPEEILKKRMDQIKVIKSDAYQTIGLRNRVMVVDDSHVNILKAEHILKENGFFTASAISGAECLKKLKMDKADLILLDIEMPQMNGFEVLEALRSDPETAKIPVIFVTADKSVDVVLEAAKKNVAAYVTKPFDADQLIGHVRKALAGAKA